MEFEATQALEFSVSDDDTSPGKTQERIRVGQLKVLATGGQNEQLHYLYKGENVIGRRSESHITIPANTISKRHAIIEVTNDIHMIHDLGSINKTRRGKFVLKADVRYEIQDGDVLRFGDVTCLYTKMPKQTIASDSDTDTLSTSSKSQKNERLIVPCDSGTGAEVPIKIPSPGVNSINEQKAMVTTADLNVVKDSDSDSNTGSESLIIKPPSGSPVLELNNNINNSKPPSPKDSEKATAKNSHLTDFMKTGIILSDSECSDNDEEVAVANALPKQLVPETPACEILQQTSVNDNSSPLVRPERFNLDNLVSSSDSDTDIDEDIKTTENAAASKKETAPDLREPVTNDGDSEELSDFLSAETQIYPQNVDVKKSNVDSKSSVASESPPLSEKQTLIKSSLKAQPTIVPMDNSMDWLELPTQPNISSELFDAEDDETVASTSKSAKPLTEMAGETAGNGDDKESHFSDWASMATQPYVIKTLSTSKCLQENDEDVDLFDAATQLYPTSRIEATAKSPIKEDHKIQEVLPTDTEPIDPIQGTEVAARDKDDVEDLATADTLPIEHFECEGAAERGKNAENTTESDGPCFTSPPCTDEETIKLKQTIAEVLTSPALALTQEMLGDTTEHKENTSNQISANENRSESPLPERDEKRAKTKVAKGRASRAPAGRMSTRRMKNSAAALSEQENDDQDIAEKPRSAFRAYRKTEDNENAQENVEEEQKIESSKMDCASTSGIHEKGGVRSEKQERNIEFPDSAKGSKDTPSKDANDLKDTSPAVIGPTPPSGPRTRRSMAGKHRRTPEKPESDSSDNSQVLANRRRTLRGSALKKAAANLSLPLTSKPQRKRSALVFDSSDEDTTDVVEDLESASASTAANSRSDFVEPEKLVVPKSPEREATISESQWQRLEEEIAELSGEGKTYQSTSKFDVPAVPFTTEPPVLPKEKEKSSIDIAAGGRDITKAESAPASAEAQVTKQDVDAVTPVPTRRKAGKSEVTELQAPPICPSKEDELGVSKTSRSKSKRRKTSKTLELQPEAMDELGENSAKDTPAPPKDVSPNVENELDAPKPLPASDALEVEATIKGPKTKRRKTSKTRELQPEATDDLGEISAKDSPAPTKDVLPIDANLETNVKSESEAPKQLPASEALEVEAITKGSPRLRRSAVRTPKANKSSKATKQGSLTDIPDGGSEDTPDDPQEERSRRSGISRLQNLKTDATAPRSNLKQSKVTEAINDSKNPQSDKRVSWSQETDAENLQPEGKRKPGRPPKRSAKAKISEDSGTRENSEEKASCSTSADSTVDDVEEEEEVLEHKKVSRGSKKKSAAESGPVDFTPPAARAQRKSASKYRRLVILSDSNVDSATTEYESEPLPVQKKAPAKRMSAAQRRAIKAKAELEDEDPSGKSTMKRVAAQEPQTPAKRKRGSAAVSSDLASPEAGTSKQEGKCEASQKPVIAKRSRISKSDTPAVEKKSDDTESLDEFEIKSPSPVRAGRGRPRKTPLKKEAESPEAAPKLTPGRPKAIPRSLPKIMFTGISEKSLEKIVKDLHGSLVDSVFECTHLVTDKVRRTMKFLCTLARGCHIVSPAWLKQCKAEKSFIDAAPYIVADESAEKQYQFKLTESLTKARGGSFLNGFRIHATKSVKPPPEEMQTIIKCAGGTYLTRMPTSGNDVIVVTCPEDLQLCKKAKKADMTVVDTEFILTGVLRQEIEIEPYRC